MKLAAIDLGSNSVKLTVADAGERLTVVHETSEVTRVGEGLDRNGFLLDAAMDRTAAKMRAYVEKARELGAQTIRCVGTAGLRGAANAKDFLARVEAETGVRIEIIDGMREAELAFRAPAAAFGPRPVVVADIGGRSTELISGTTSEMIGRVSLEIGSVRLTERFLPSDPPAEAELEACRAHLREVLAAAPDALPDARLIGVSGTVMSIAGLVLGLESMAQVVRLAEGFELTVARVHGAYEDLRHVPASRRIFGDVIPAGRADVIVAGAMIVEEILHAYDAGAMLASSRGLRYGLLEEMRREVC